MFCYKLTIAYDGTAYVGWQVQPNGTAIQSLLESALVTLLKTPIRVIGSGRTDSGVHALGQTAHFKTQQPLDCKQMVRRLNGILPLDIRILELLPMSSTFHARYSAIRKEYHYHLWLDPVITPFVRPYRYHIPYPIDQHLLRQASHILSGTHDFATFANSGHGVKTTIRTLYRIDIIQQEGGVRLEFEGNGFLYKMIRNLVGVLIEIASGCRSLHTLPMLLAEKNRRAAGRAAPAHALFLMKVHYPPLASFYEKGNP